MHGVGIQLRSVVPPLRGVGLCLAVLVFGFAQPAYSFFPFGGFQADGDVVFLKWALSTLDRDNDGDVSGDNDGVVMTIRVGDDGYNNSELPTILEAFDTWENLPGSYIAFSFTEPISDPIFFGVADGFSSVTTFASEEVEGVDPDGVAGIATWFGFIEDFLIEVPATELAVEGRGGQLYEIDLIVGEAFFRNVNDETDDLNMLKGIMVHEIGHGIGIGHNPMQNFSNLDELFEEPVEGEDPPEFFLQEDAILPLRNGNGVLRTVGVTPTMHPFIFGTLDSQTELFYPGQLDLSPDDIAVAHFLYPRQGQVDDFFTLHQQARRRFPGIDGVPTPQIAGGLVTAYVDHDNNDSTGRVPLISTMSGLYTNGSNNGNLDLDGRFSMFGLPKQLESSGGVLFDASYTFSLTRIGDVPPFQNPLLVDTMHGFNPDVDGREDAVYDTSFISEVFNEEGNLLDTTRNLAGGTPMRFDPVRRQIVSTNSGRTLDQILAGGTPMFGASPTESVCPLDIVLLGAGTTTDTTTGGGLELPDRLTLPTPQLGMVASVRGFRDMWLFKSSIGRLAVDGYYRIAPYVARFLGSHRAVTEGVRSFVSLVSAYWVLAFSFWAVTVCALAWAWSRGKGGRLRVLRWIGAAAILLACIPAQATTLLAESTAELTARSSNIVQGTVISKRTYQNSLGRILTDYVIQTNNVVKGTMNKQTTFTLTILGGNLNGFIAHVPGLPKFGDGEEVVVFLRDTKTKGLVVTGAEQGKLTVHTDEKTGKKFVNSKSLRSKRGLPAAKRSDPDKAIAKDEDGELVEPEGLVSVEQYTAYLRDIVNKQARAQE